MPRKKVEDSVVSSTEKVKVRITENDIKSYRDAKSDEKEAKKKIETLRDKFIAHAESTDFEEDSKVLIVRGSETITVTKIESVKVISDALNKIEEDEEFNKLFKSAIKQVKVLDTALFEELVTKAVEKGDITRRKAKQFFVESSTLRVT